MKAKKFQKKSGTGDLSQGLMAVPKQSCHSSPRCPKAGKKKSEAPGTISFPNKTTRL